MVLASYPIHPAALNDPETDPAMPNTVAMCVEAAQERALAGGYDPAAVVVRWVAVAEIGQVRTPWSPGDPAPGGTYALVCEAGIP